MFRIGINREIEKALLLSIAHWPSVEMLVLSAFRQQAATTVSFTMQSRWSLF